MSKTGTQTPETLIVSADAAGMRLDLFLLEKFPARSRGDIQRIIKTGGNVHIAGKRVVKPSTLLREGQQIMLTWPTDVFVQAPTAQELPSLRILHEEPTLLVIDKPAGFPVHAGAKPEPTIADALLARFPDLGSVGDPARAGIVHRLDKDTSGILLIARTPELYEYLKKRFALRQVRKTYLALIHGVMPESDGSVKLPIARSKRNPLRRTIARKGEGKEAETAFRVLERFHEHTLLEVYPRTGRMHQIRVHLAHLGFPVAGDPLYGRKSHYRTPPGLRRQFLHAAELTIPLPSGKAKTFESPLPEELQKVLYALRHKSGAPPDTPVTYRWRSPRA